MVRAKRAIKSMVKQNPAKAAKSILNEAKRKGKVPYIYNILARRPDLLAMTAEQRETIRNPKFIDPKTAELVAVGAAAAIKCKSCVKLHMEEALRKGASLDQIFETIFIACLISKASTLADSFREFEKLATPE